MLDAALVNSIVSGIVGVLSGIAGAWFAYRLALRRDNVRWEHEQARMTEQMSHERELAELAFRRRISEIEAREQQRDRYLLKRELLRGTNEPETLRGLVALRDRLSQEASSHRLLVKDEVACLPLVERLIEVWVSPDGATDRLQ